MSRNAEAKGVRENFYSCYNLVLSNCCSGNIFELFCVDYESLDSVSHRTVQFASMDK